MNDFSKDIRYCIETLRNGGLILYPTDTIWGIGCDARNSNAVNKIYQLKKRFDRKSMLVLVDSIESMESLVPEVPEIAYELQQAAVNPLTIIYDKAEGVAPELLAEDGSLGIRITEENFSHELCRRFGHPIVSTSANISGQTPPECFKNISEEIKNGVDYIVNYRQEDCSPRKASNIIKIGKSGLVKIIR